jgi:Cu/Ag efflux protein CusF
MPMQMEMALPPGPNGMATGVKGEITRLDIPNGRVAIRHEPIANLNMNGMNMVFRLAQPSLADGLKVGDKVVFEAERKDGAITLTKVEKAPN